MSTATTKKPAENKPRTAYFTVEAALLEELGERLVAAPEVALTELIKNAYDADAKECLLSVGQDGISVKDDGNGMTVTEFLKFWMVVGTKGKARENLSRKFKRKVSGSKGIGRFAVRFLGSELVLTTIAYDAVKKKYSVIVATFDWEKASQHDSLSEIKIPYTVTEVQKATPGTTLKISKLRPGVKGADLSAIATQTITLTTPIDGLEKPAFVKESKNDPGFTVKFGDEASNLSQAESVQSKVLKYYVARVRIEVINNNMNVVLTFDRSNDVVFKRTIALKKYYPDFAIATPLFIDIRYFPTRKGTFAELGVDGVVGRRWFKENSGIAIVDNGFRILPYGTKDDDWLKQSSDIAQNVRNRWRSSIMEDLFPLAPEAGEPRNNPLLYLPGSGQVFGAVFVATLPMSSKGSAYQLTPSMDRQGYIGNKAFEFVRSITRFGLELIAYFDHQRVRKAEEEEEARQLKGAEEDLSAAILEIRKSKTIGAEEKSRLTSLLKVAATNYKEVDDYRKKAQESLETMSLLGVLAGFMTHEFEQTIFRLNEAIQIIKEVSKSHKDIQVKLVKLEDSKRHLESFLGYSKLFTSKLGDSGHTSFTVGPQIQFVLETLLSVQEKHGIEVEIQVPKDLPGPSVPLSAYSGILLNLLTNAYKALIAREGSGPRKVRVIAITNGKRHRLIVADNGVGIPKRLRKRIWEPLFTTTSPDLNPMGSGMGLGLAIVQRVVTHIGGKVSLAETPPEGFNTAFEVELPT
jgi:signal transduction histidine kinase